MSNAYNNNQSWSQHQSLFGQSSQSKEFDFSAMSANPDNAQHHPQSQPGYSYHHPSQMQLSNSNGQPSSMIQANFSSSQPQPRPFTNQAPAPMKAETFNGFTSNTAPNQNIGSYSSLHPHPHTEQTWSDPVSFAYEKSLQNNQPTYNGTTENMYLTSRLSSSPSAMQDAFPPSYEYVPATATATSDPRIKRSREQSEEKDQVKDTTKTKGGACNRCKNLKVKCEFKTDTDPCKRCLNGGHECFIPGRKKRRTPPKREHLLNQIREQAAQIKDLMAQLETTGKTRPRRLSSTASDSFASSSAVQSPLLSPTTSHASVISGDRRPSSQYSNSEANKAIEDWIAKAKQSFEEFDVFIGIGGAGMPKSYLVDEDLENSEEEDLEEEDYANMSDNDTSDYDIAVVHHDSDEVRKDQTTLAHKASSSSLNTDGTSHTRRKHTGGSSKLAVLPGVAVPFGLFHDLSLKSGAKRRGNGADDDDDLSPGIAGANFFRSTPEVMDKRLANLPQPPHILTHRVITPQQAEELFQIYFQRMNLSVSLLDPVLYTAQKTCYRSPFLFTVICAIASRFYSGDPGLYTRLMEYAQQAAGLALIRGHKNVEMCQAYILLSLYPVPAKRWEDQRNWLYLGLAIRTATDLNLNLPNTAKPVNENHAREMLNRTRVWLNCFNLDRSTGSYYGKPPVINNADYMANHSEDWWKSSPYNMRDFDIQICAYNAELKIMANFVSKIYSDPEHPTGLNKEVDFERIATETDDELKRLQNKWMAVLGTTDMSSPQNSFRTGLLRLAYPYARLVALSYGFQHAFGKNNTDENPFLMRCMDAAFDVVNNVLNDVCRPSQRIYWRHGPEAQSVFLTFASAFLVKLLQPKFASYLTTEIRLDIRSTVQKVVDLLSSEEIAIDDRHGPKLYSKFLKNLLAAPMARVDLNSPSGSLRKSRLSPNLARSLSDELLNPEDGRSSRAGSASLSPPPRQEALSFDSFAPAGAIDPFAVTPNTLALSLGNTEEGSSNMMSEFFQPPTHYDDAIMQNMQTIWNDPNYNWNTFQQSLDMDFRAQEPVLYSEQQYGLQQ